MAVEFPFFVWQREYNKRWISYSYEDCCILNKAAAKAQKTVTLPSSDPQKKLIINIEKMVQKNAKSGYEQRLRCLIANKSFYWWAYIDEDNKVVSYTPQICYYLEVAFVKKLVKVNILRKSEYEMHLKNLTQRNKESGLIRPMIHEEIKDVKCMQGKEDEIVFFRDFCASEVLIKYKAAESEVSIRNILYSLPTLGPCPDTSRSTKLTPTPNKVISALSKEAQASTSAAVIPVDPSCPVAHECDVYIEKNVVYHATLNFTNVQENNNKFFIIQLLKYKSLKKCYALWLHWGRVGYAGQSSLKPFGKDLAEAKCEFENKFFEKTHNNWENKDIFNKLPSKYDLVHTDLSIQIPQSLVRAETKLDKKVQDLLQLICNRENLEAAAKELAFDSKVTPLGNITAKQILDGYKVLKKITELINVGKMDGKEIQDACNDFYTKIPHDFGRKTPPLLRTIDDVNEKMKMMESLSNICLAMNVLSSSSTSLENPVDTYYKSLECNITPLSHRSPEFKALKKCLLQGPTHNMYEMELVDAFRCEKDNQNFRFQDFGNKKLLFHGSRNTNWIGILKKGLQIAPPEAPSTGFMFGRALYFADVASKSANYCFPTKKHNEGLVLLSEVSLGTVIDAIYATDFTDLPSEFKSVRGIGRYQPKSFERTVLSPQATAPCGPLKKSDIKQLELYYNEYVVYNINQVKMKYLLRVKFNF